MTPRPLAALLTCLAVFCLSVISVSGCAARRPVRDVYAESTAHLRAGCYHCLQDGLGLVGSGKDLRSRLRTFEFLVLLVARSKELGLWFGPWIDHAKSLAPTLPAAVAAPAFVALAEALRQDPAGLDRDQDFEQRRFGIEDRVRAWVTAIEASAASVEVKTYFALAATCSFLGREQRDAIVARGSAVAPGVPLLEYAVGACASSEEKWLLRALAQEPRFDDAAYPLGRYRLNRLVIYRPNEDPANPLERARAAFPDSAAIVYTHGALLRFRRDWVRALEAFDTTLRLVPKHHEARLGRVLASSMLARHDEAIASATSLIDEGRWLVADAYYWRAWNYYTLERFDESERDVEQAKQRMRSSAVYVLSGLVQWRKKRPTVAESELTQAVKMNASDCDAANYLGGVRAELRTWLPASDAFAAADACHDRELVALRATLADMVAQNAPPAAIESQKKGIAATEQQAAEMAYNRGAMLANAGDVAAARNHIERARRHRALQDKAADLLQRLDQKR